MIPLLIVVFQIKLQIAVGAVAIALFPAAVIATLFNSRQQTVDYMLALWLEIPTVLGTVLGAYLTSILSVKKLEIFFSLFLVYLSIKLFRNPHDPRKSKSHFNDMLNKIGPKIKRKNHAHRYEIGALAAIFFGGFSGVVAGMFGIGGGFLKTPIMINIFNVPPKTAVGTALLMIVFTSLTSSISHASLGHIDWKVAYPIAIGFSIGAIVGNLLKKHFSEHHTNRLISIGLFMAGISLLVNGFV